MKFEEWDPLYTEILSYFSFSRADDERSAKLLASLVEQDALLEAKRLIKTREQIVVCGNAPCLQDELHALELSDSSREKLILIAADGASLVLHRECLTPDIIVTDLDGIYDAREIIYSMNRNGTILVIHAHGDNTHFIQSFVPFCAGPVICTTQAEPFSHVYNFGGFSDGDRAVFFAHALGAMKVTLCGFDLDDEKVDPIKRGKLLWARRLLGMLGYSI
ncbi:MAG: DUF115 domain-containing protein [Methanomicrobiales archaeon]|jgi:uncharacterized Rossmann fold enzyme|nr:DUF115 domain-containing protein [Methanomicrobiales archaeon]